MENRYLKDQKYNNQLEWPKERLVIVLTFCGTMVIKFSTVYNFTVPYVDLVCTKVLCEKN